MGIHEIKGIGPATVKKLNKAGIRTLDDLRTLDVAAVAEKTGIAERRLTEWRLEAKMTKVLDDVKGIGPATKKKLQDAGIRNLDDLVRASIHEVAHATSIAQERVSEWQVDAKKKLQDAQAFAKREYPQALEHGKRVATDAKAKGSAAYTRGREVAGRLADDTRDRFEQARRSSVAAGTDSQDGSSKSDAGDRRPGLFQRIRNALSR